MKNYKEVNKEEVIEYKYKSELTTLGYTEEEINEIEDIYNETEVQEYLLTKKYDSLLEFRKSTIFNIENLDRYDTYEKNNEGKYSSIDVVTYVEVGLDKEFYTEISEITNYDNPLVLVNKYNKLPSKYEASDLVTLTSKYSSSSQKMKKVAAEAMMQMIDAAKSDGLSMKVISGYRTESLQNTLFTNSTKRNGLEHALIYSAKPGHSEHQTGFAADINSVQESFKNTNEYTWLIDNSYKYGFIERYPSGKEFITGYGYEPWHYRYIGVEDATKVHEAEITFEEYYVLYLRDTD